ncbi:MAG: GSCFA domain-containing protein [Bacteroidota bacterium]
MSSFRTVLQASPAKHSINYQDQSLSMGSCFAQHIGRRLQALQFSVLLNPFGILYNPLSIANGLRYLLSDQWFTPEDLFLHQGLWHSFAHHGRFSDPDQSLALAKINEALDQGRQQLRRSNRLLITLGTAQVFYHLPSEQAVANCHKLPDQMFVRKQLSPQEITSILQPLFQQLYAAQPDLKIITSVSPVRHLRDGLVQNQRSKASLLLALQTISEQLPFVSYFPAYELLLDDLRDYRFYEADMLHPNGQAIDYIWNFFKNQYLDAATQQIGRAIEKIKQASEHRPFHPHSPAHQQFLQKQLQQIEQLIQRYPFLDFAEEKARFTAQLI